MINPTVIVLITGNPRDEKAFMSSFDDKKIISKCEVIDANNGSTVLEDVLIEISKYMSIYGSSAERVTFIINNSVANYFEFKKEEFKGIIGNEHICKVRVYIEDELLYFDEKDVRDDNYFYSFNKTEAMIQKFVLYFKEKYVVKPHIKNANYYFFGSGKNNHSLLLNLLCDTYCTLMDEQYYLCEEENCKNLRILAGKLNPILQFSKISFIDFERDHDLFKLKNDAFIFIDYSYKNAIDFANNLLSLNPTIHVFVFSDNDVEKIANLETISFAKFGYKYFNDIHFDISYNRFINALNNKGVERAELEKLEVLDHNSEGVYNNFYDKHYVYLPNLVLAARYADDWIKLSNKTLNKNERRDTIAKTCDYLSKFYKDGSALYSCITHLYLGGSVLYNLADLEHVRWMVRTILCFNAYEEKKKYFVFEYELIIDLANIPNIEPRVMYKSDKVLPDFINALVASRIYLGE